MENTEPQNGTLTTGVEDPLAGQQISHYSVVRRLGRGGMGLVYLARHRTLEKNVAIKFLSGQLLESPDYVARFLHEARAAASLHHQNIVSVTDAGEEDGAYYLVMEYVEGANLSELMRNGRCFAEEEVVRFGIKIASALAYAHKKGIVHRDIKPENLFLTNEGELKVGDLGLAKRLNTGEASMTLAGSVLGTPFYISPEQILESKDVDGRTDIYSLGASLYHLAAGQVPYKGVSSAQIMSKHLTEPVPWPKNVNPTLSEGFCRALYKMMAKEAGERFQSMEEVGEILHAILRGRDPRIETSRTVIPSGIAADPGGHGEFLCSHASSAARFERTQVAACFSVSRFSRGASLRSSSRSTSAPTGPNTGAVAGESARFFSAQGQGNIPAKSHAGGPSEILHGPLGRGRSGDGGDGSGNLCVSFPPLREISVKRRNVRFTSKGRWGSEQPTRACCPTGQDRGKRAGNAHGTDCEREGKTCVEQILRRNASILPQWNRKVRPNAGPFRKHPGTQNDVRRSRLIRLGRSIGGFTSCPDNRESFESSRSLGRRPISAFNRRPMARNHPCVRGNGVGRLGTAAQPIGKKHAGCSSEKSRGRPATDRGT